MGNVLHQLDGRVVGSQRSRDGGIYLPS